MSLSRCIVVLTLGLGCAACVGPDIPRLSDPAAVESFRLEGLHVVRAGQGDQARMLFLHGTPGNWEGFSWYLEDAQLRRRFELFAVDRPGFGRSELPLMPALDDQARALLPLCRAHGPFVAVGHSLGAPVALALADLAPDCVEAVVSIAGSVAARYEQPRWFNHLAEQAWLKWLLPDAFRRANTEVLQLPEELARLEARLAALQVPVVVIQGEQDALVDPRSAPLLVERLGGDAPVRLHMLPEHGHFVIWEFPELIRETLLQELAHVLG